MKIRGFRIELGEIETVLRQHPQVLQAVAIAREEIPGQKRLVAYVVSHDSQPTTDELRHFLKQKLPNYMVPAAFMLLETLPMTPNRKVDYLALPAPEFSRSVEDTFIAPRTLAEEKLVTIWSEVLRVENVGIHDNFFELGGDSILSIQLISRANQAGIQIAPKQLFKYQTIAELASVAGITRQVKAEQGLVTGSVALTPIQKWFLSRNCLNLITLTSQHCWKCHQTCNQSNCSKLYNNCYSITMLYVCGLCSQEKTGNKLTPLHRNLCH